MILYVNACPRKGSRTDRLAKALLETLGEYTEIVPGQMDLRPLDDERLDYRTGLIEKGSYDDDIFLPAKQFAGADCIVIAAPYWDGSFPAILKTYIENIYVTGIVSEYGPDGSPRGLCRAEKLYYVTSAGGPYDPRFSYDHIHDLAIHMFGIKEAELVCADMMDIEGNDPEAILAEKIKELKNKRA